MKLIHTRCDVLVVDIIHCSVNIIHCSVVYSLLWQYAYGSSSDKLLFYFIFRHKS